MIDQTQISISGHMWCVCAACAGVGGLGGGVGLVWERVWAGVHRCGNVCGMNFQNFFQRIESLHQRTLIRILQCQPKQTVIFKIVIIPPKLHSIIKSS